MMFLLIAVLMQVQIALPQRARLENPSVANPIPKQVQKDFDKLWKKFLTGREDAKVFRELDKLLKKSVDAVPVMMVQSYIDLYAGRQGDAERRLEVILARSPSDVAALSTKHNAVGGACIQVRDLSVRVRMERAPRTAATSGKKPE